MRWAFRIAILILLLTFGFWLGYNMSVPFDPETGSLYSSYYALIEHIRNGIIGFVLGLVLFLVIDV